MELRKYLILVAMMVLGSVGNVALSRGMKHTGKITPANWTAVFAAMLNPWVISGILVLIAFMAAYLTALSWADLTYVLPATGVGYVLTALMGKFLLHETVPLKRWIGIALITVGVGFVAGGPPIRPLPDHSEDPAQA